MSLHRCEGCFGCYERKNIALRKEVLKNDT